MTTETLITDGANTSEATEQLTTTEPAATAAAAPVEGTQAPEKADEQTASDKPEGAPDKYEFKVVDGLEFDSETLAAYAEVAKELNLPQENAQKVLDKLAPALATQQQQRLEAAKTEWVEAAKTDKEFGGEKLGENLAAAKRALDKFGTPELRVLLNASGLGNHPEVIRMMVRAGKAISEDKVITSGQDADASASKTDPKALYPNSNLK